MEELVLHELPYYSYYCDADDFIDHYWDRNIRAGTGHLMTV